MPVEVNMPRLTDSMEEGTVLKWMKKEGEEVKKGEPILELATDKANMELESFDNGVLDKILVPEGETVPIGTTIAIIRLPGEAPSAEPSAPAKEAPAKEAPAEEAEAKEEAPAPAVPPPTAAVEEPSEEAPSAAPAGEEERIKASPLARRLAEEHGVDLAAITGTGPGGRIIKEDVDEYLARRDAAPAAAPAEAPAAAPAAAPAPPAAPLPGEDVALSRMQATIARRMVESKTTVPHFYVTTEIDMTEAAKLRKQLNEAAAQFEAQEVSYNDLVVKAAATALKKYPQVNAFFQGDKIHYNESINIGIAVALPQGLVVPVVHDVDKKGLRQIAAEAKALIERSRNNRPGPDDYKGGTFSVSNLGMFDVDEFSAIISPPQSAILAVGAVKEKPVVIDGEIRVSLRMRVTLSADHRVYYGADAALFLRELKRLLENPLEMLV